MNAIERIISAIPAEAGFTDADRDEARTLLMACVLWALQYDRPGCRGIEELRGLKNGSGCWLGSLRQGIDAADLTTNERGFFLGGLGMAKALLMSLSLTTKEPAVAVAAPHAPKKRAGRKNLHSSVPRSAARVREIVLPPEWVS